MTTRISLTPKQAQALRSAKDNGFVLARHGVADGIHHNPSVIGMCVCKGVLRVKRSYGRSHEYTLTQAGARWLLEEAEK